MLSFQEFLSEMVTFPDDIKHKIENHSDATIIRHKPAHNTDVHNHLVANGFRQNGASSSFGPQVHTEYVHRTTGATATHVKSSRQSYVEFHKK